MKGINNIPGSGEESLKSLAFVDDLFKLHKHNCAFYPLFLTPSAFTHQELHTFKLTLHTYLFKINSCYSKYFVCKMRKMNVLGKMYS